MITALCMPSAMTRASYSPLSFGSRNRTECVTSSLATTSNPALKCNVWTSAAYTSATGARNVCRATGTRFTAGVEALISSSEDAMKSADRGKTLVDTVGYFDEVVHVCVGAC